MARSKGMVLPRKVYRNYFQKIHLGGGCFEVSKPKNALGNNLSPR